MHNDAQPDAQRAMLLITRLQEPEAPIDDITDELIAIGPNAANALAAALQSGHAESQEVAVTVLSRLDSRRALATILNGISILKDRPDLGTMLLYKASTLLVPQDKERVRPLFLQFLQHADPGIRLATIECVKSTHDDELLAIIRQQTTHIHEANTVPNPNTQHTVPRAASMALIEALGSEDNGERNQAVSSLLHHPDRQQIIAEHLHHANPRLRLSVLTAAGEMQSPTWSKALLDIGLDQNRPTAERVLALQGVTRLDNDTADLDRIRLLFEQETGALSEEAGRLLAMDKRADFRRIALEKLNHANPSLRETIIDTWTANAGASYQSDLPIIIGLLPFSSWLRTPSAADIAMFKTLCAGIARVVELGVFFDPTLLDQFSNVRASVSPDVQTIVVQTTHLLAESTGYTPYLDALSTTIHNMANLHPSVRIQAVRALEQEPPSNVQRALPFIIAQLYRASPDELVAWIRVLQPLSDHRATTALRRLKQHPLDEVRAAIP